MVGGSVSDNIERKKKKKKRNKYLVYRGFFVFIYISREKSFLGYYFFLKISIKNTVNVHAFVHSSQCWEGVSYLYKLERSIFELLEKGFLVSPDFSLFCFQKKNLKIAERVLLISHK